MKSVCHFEMQKAGLFIERQKPVPVVYKDIKLDCGYRIDILVENAIVVELKTVDAFNPVHEAQILTYMKSVSYTHLTLPTN